MIPRWPKDFRWTSDGDEVKFKLPEIDLTMEFLLETVGEPPFLDGDDFFYDMKLRGYVLGEQVNESYSCTAEGVAEDKVNHVLGVMVETILRMKKNLEEKNNGTIKSY